MEEDRKSLYQDFVKFTVLLFCHIIFWKVFYDHVFDHAQIDLSRAREHT